MAGYVEEMIKWEIEKKMGSGAQTSVGTTPNPEEDRLLAAMTCGG